jgi:predicted transcriptional regulator
MKYRSRTEIIAAILQAANEGATQTRIMYGAYLSYSQVKEYLPFLQSRGLLRYEEGAQLYWLTEKGMELLRHCETLGEMISLDEVKRAPETKPNPASIF